MSSTDWEDREIVGAYCDANGGDEHKQGDDWRLWLVNPLVWAVSNHLHAGAQATVASSRPDPDNGSANESRDQGDMFDVQKVHAALGATRRGAAGIKGWYSSITDRPLKGLTVIDLGCGEGHLGRWLGPAGVDYTGLDSSAAMIDVARKRSRSKKGDSGPRFFQADLDVKGSLKDATQAIASSNAVLVTSIISLDHLEHPERLLRELGEMLSNQLHRLVLLVILNPEYVVEEMWESELPTQATIASAGRTVRVTLRSRRKWESMLRDTGYVVHAFTPLSFPMYQENRKSKATSYQLELARPEDIEYAGVPPFFGIVCEPRRSVSRRSTDIQQALDGVRAVPRSGEATEGLEKYVTDLELLRFMEGDTILARHNLGGDLYLLADGEARLRANDGVTVFAKGDLFGELESGFGYHSSYYPHTVTATRPDTAVIRIPNLLVGRITAEHRCPGWHLFEQLRRRLAVGFWTLNVRPGRDTVVEKGKKDDISLVRGSRIAREILAASEVARQTLRSDMHPDSSNRSLDVELNVASLMKSLGMKDSDKRDRLNQVMAPLAELGFIDVFLADQLRTSYDQLVSEMWQQFIGASLEALNPAYFTSDESKRMASSPAIAAVKKLASKTGDTAQGVSFKLDIQKYCQVVPRLTAWWDMVTDTGSFLHQDSSYYFVRIRDLDALRIVALGEDDEVRNLLSAAKRSLWHGNPGAFTLMDLGDVQRLGRLRTYLSAFFHHREEKLREALKEQDLVF